MIYKEHGMIELDHQQLAQNLGTYLVSKVDEWLAMVADVDHEDYKRIKELSDGLEQLGRTEQESVWQLNDQLKHPLHQLMIDAKGGGQVATLLQQLQNLMVKIKPPKRSLLASFKSMFRLLFSWHDSAWQLWLESYPEYKQEIITVSNELEKLKRRLQRDNKILSSDHHEMESRILKLEHCYDLLGLIEEKLSLGLADHTDTSKHSNQMFKDELIPPVQQRIIELQQQLLISRQAVMTLELFIQQNKSSVKGIEQAIYTTQSVVDVTAGIVLVNNRKKSMEAFSDQAQSPGLKVDTQQLKQARLIIDQALGQVDEVKQETRESAQKVYSNNGLNATNSSVENG